MKLLCQKILNFPQFLFNLVTTEYVSSWNVNVLIVQGILPLSPRKHITNIGLVPIFRIMIEFQQETQCGLTSKFYSALMLALHVSDLIGPSSRAFCTSCIRRLLYVVIRVLLDTSSRYEVVGRTASKTLLMMDRWGPKHVELTQVLNKLTH